MFNHQVEVLQDLEARVNNTKLAEHVIIDLNCPQRCSWMQITSFIGQR